MYPGRLHTQLDEAGPAPESTQVVRQSRMACTIAAVSDGSGLPTRPVYVAAQNAQDLSAGLRGLPPDIEAVVLIHTDPACSTPSRQLRIRGSTLRATTPARSRWPPPTPSDRLLPDPMGPALSSTVEHAVARALAPRPALRWAHRRPDPPRTTSERAHRQGDAR